MSEAQPAPNIFTQVPPQVPHKRGQLTGTQLNQLFQEGYVQVDDFFPPEDLEPVKAEIAFHVDLLAKQLYKHGKIKNLYEDVGLFQRLTRLEEEFPGAAILIHKMGKLPQAFADLQADERLVNVAEQVLGTSDIVGHPVWNIRSRVPKVNQMTVPWHQDAAYMDPDAAKTYQLTAWIPMLDSKPENGCMQVVPGGHVTGKVAKHTACWEDTWYIELSEEEIRKTLGVDPDKNTVTCAVPFGGVLFFSNVLPHRSLPNTSNDIRWSFDLRWQRADDPVGFYGMKHGVRLRSSTDPNHKVNWDRFNNVDRQHLQQTEECDFDTCISGPWMDNWELVHQNRHTDHWVEAKTHMATEPFTVY